MKYEVNKKYTEDLRRENNHNEPSLYQVLIHNDDYTPMEFVVAVLEQFFYLGREQAAEVMFKAHREGIAAIGQYTQEVAEMKVSQVIDYARKNEHPFICSLEAV